MTAECWVVFVRPQTSPVKAVYLRFQMIFRFKSRSIGCNHQKKLRIYLQCNRNMFHIAILISLYLDYINIHIMATGNRQQATGNRQLSIALAAVVAMLGSVNAATIAWSGVGNTLTSSGDRLATGTFDKTGTLVLAENSGGAALTFDGIAFTAPTISFGGGSFNGFHGTGTALSQTGTYGAAGSASAVALTGLTIGNTYRIQALIADTRVASINQGYVSSFDGNIIGQFLHSGALVTGTFVADATTQSFTTEVFRNSGTGVSQGGQLNALTLYQTAAAIPEPSSAALLGLGGLALILRRRK